MIIKDVYEGEIDLGVVMLGKRKDVLVVTTYWGTLVDDCILHYFKKL